MEFVERAASHIVRVNTTLRVPQHYKTSPGIQIYTYLVVSACSSQQQSLTVEREISLPSYVY